MRMHINGGKNKPPNLKIRRDLIRHLGHFPSTIASLSGGHLPLLHMQNRKLPTLTASWAPRSVWGSSDLHCDTGLNAALHKFLSFAPGLLFVATQNSMLFSVDSSQNV